VSELTILGFDSATAEVAVAATRGDVVLREHSVPPGPGGRPRHARELLPRLADAAEAAGGWERIDLIGVGVGPGSFTGLRIGVATARALGQGLDKQLAPVVSLRALARGAADFDSEQPRLALIDARRGQVFGGLYAASGEELWEPFVAAPEDAARRLANLTAAPLAHGDGSIRFRRVFEAAGAEVPDDEDEAHRLRARWICALAGRASPLRPEAIEPIYLRPPDADLWREQQRAQRSSGDGGRG
jgi:tRNA threonylcarbamoyladenosine biosynthesis protein TsaB